MTDNAAAGGGATLMQRLAAVAAEVEPIRATGQNEYKRKALSIGDVEEAVGSLLAKHRVLTLWRRAELEKLEARLWRSVLVCRLVNADDRDDAFEVEWEDIGSNPSAAYSFVRKGFYKALLHLADDEQENEGAGGHQPSGFTTPQAARARAPQGRTEQRVPRPQDCPDCAPKGVRGTVVWRQDGKGAFCAGAKGGCRRELTEADFAEPAPAPAEPPPLAAGEGGTAAVPPAESPAEGQSLTLAQQIAMTCREAGIDRATLIRAVTGKERGRDLDRDEALTVLSEAKSIQRGTVRLVNADDRWVVEPVERAS